MHPPPPFTRQGILKGGRLALPFGVSSFIYGIAFGLMAGQVGLSVAEAVIMSAVVFSGTAQVAAVQAWATAPALLPLFVTVMIVNARYILMGAALRPWLGPLPWWKSGTTLLTLVDGSFALAMRERERGDDDVGVLLGSGLVSYAGWVIATGIGLAVGQSFADPKALGLDFVVIAFCASAAAMMAQTTRDWWPVVAAGLAVVIGERVAPGAWIVVAAGVTAAIVAMARYRPVHPELAP